MPPRSLLLLAFAAPFLMATTDETSRGPEPRTVAAVLAAADDWIASERLGRIPALGARLADSYRDVESNGRAHSKAELLEHTATRKDVWPGTAADVARAFHDRYPSVKEVVLEGDTAMISYHPTDPARARYVIAEDTFTYQGGMWRGVMSSHFKLDAAPGT